MTALGPKALACLRVAEARYADGEDEAHVRHHNALLLYGAACARWSEKAVLRKFEELCVRGYLDALNSPRMARLSYKGREALAAQYTQAQNATLPQREA